MISTARSKSLNQKTHKMKCTTAEKQMANQANRLGSWPTWAFSFPVIYLEFTFGTRHGPPLAYLSLFARPASSMTSHPPTSASYIFGHSCSHFVLFYFVLAANWIWFYCIYCGGCCVFCFCQILEWFLVIVSCSTDLSTLSLNNLCLYTF